MPYPGRFTNCHKSPSQGGLPLGQLRAYAAALGVTGVKQLDRQQLCQKIARKEGRVLPKAISPAKKDGCQPRYTKEYRDRPSPPFPAKECKGQFKKGNDGKMWVSRPDINRVYRWVHVVPGATPKYAEKARERGKLYVPQKPKAPKALPRRILGESDVFVGWEKIRSPVMDIPAKELKVDLDKMDRQCRWLTSLEMEDLVSPANRRRIKTISDLTREIVGKYDLNDDRLNREMTPRAFQNNCLQIHQMLEEVDERAKEYRKERKAGRLFV